MGGSRLRVRLSWADDQDIAPPTTARRLDGNHPCELYIGPLKEVRIDLCFRLYQHAHHPSVHGLCSAQTGITGLRITASARNCEVFVENPDALRSYAHTLRGHSTGGANLYTFVYSPSGEGGFAVGSMLSFKLLSLVDKDWITIDAVTALRGDNNHGAGAPSSAESQMDGIRGIIEAFTVGSSLQNGIDDPHRALISSIARSALHKANKPTTDDVWVTQPKEGSSDGVREAVDSLANIVEQQGHEIKKLAKGFERLEDTCQEILRLLKKMPPIGG